MLASLHQYLEGRLHLLRLCARRWPLLLRAALALWTAIAGLLTVAGTLLLLDALSAPISLGLISGSIWVAVLILLCGLILACWRIKRGVDPGNASEKTELLKILGLTLGAIGALYAFLYSEYQDKSREFQKLTERVQSRDLAVKPLLFEYYNYDPWWLMLKRRPFKDSIISLIEGAFKMRYSIKRRDGKRREDPAAFEFYGGLAELFSQISQAELEWWERRSDRPEPDESGLSDRNFRRADLSGLDLFWGYFRRADFRNADLRCASLLGGDFYKAWLNGAHLDGADLHPAPPRPLQRSPFRFVPAYTWLRGQNGGKAAGQYRCNPDGADEKASNIRCDHPSEITKDEAAMLRGSPCRTRLERAHLDGATLSGALLCGVSLRWAELPRAKLNRASLVGADLRGVRKLADADLTQASLRYADLEGADFTGAKLWCTDLTGANLRGAIVTREQIDGAIVDETTTLWDGSGGKLRQHHCPRPTFVRQCPDP